jgi:hypothetical protein
LQVEGGSVADWQEVEEFRSAAFKNIGETMIARLHDNGVEVRVDLGNTGENWPNCQQSQKGFPWLNFARENGATEIIKTGLRTE